MKKFIVLILCFASLSVQSVSADCAGPCEGGGIGPGGYSPSATYFAMPLDLFYSMIRSSILEYIMQQQGR